MAIAAPGRALSIGDAEFGERRRRVEAAAREAGLDALIAFSATNQRGASAFLTGYEPRFGPKDVAVVILIPGGKATRPRATTTASISAGATPASTRRASPAGSICSPGTA